MRFTFRVQGHLVQGIEKNEEQIGAPLGEDASKKINKIVANRIYVNAK